MENKPNNPRQFTVNPDTGKVDYGIYHNLIKIWKEFLLFYRDIFLKNENIIDINDPQFNNIFNDSKKLYNKFISHLKHNYPRDYENIKPIISKQIKELIQASLKEMSVTGAGANAGTFTPGTGENYSTPKAYSPNKATKYYYKLGWKPVPTEELHKQSKVIDHKDLWKKKLEEEQSSQQYVDSLNLSDSSLKQFVETRIKDFDKIEDKLNTLLPLLKDAKKETMEFYKNNPDFKIKYGTDLAVDYLDDLITLFREKK